jgi:hypothetical protein
MMMRIVTFAAAAAATAVVVVVVTYNSRSERLGGTECVAVALAFAISHFAEVFKLKY